MHAISHIDTILARCSPLRCIRGSAAVSRRELSERSRRGDWLHLFILIDEDCVDQR